MNNDKTPWFSCEITSEVKFNFNCDKQAIWDALYPTNMARVSLPIGWEFLDAGRDSSTIVLFGVRGLPAKEDGEKVQAILTEIENLPN